MRREGTVLVYYNQGASLCVGQDPRESEKCATAPKYLAHPMRACCKSVATEHNQAECKLPSGLTQSRQPGPASPTLHGPSNVRRRKQSHACMSAWLRVVHGDTLQLDMQPTHSCICLCASTCLITTCQPACSVLLSAHVSHEDVADLRGWESVMEHTPSPPACMIYT